MWRLIPWLALLLLLLLVLAFVVRRKRWGAVAWLPPAIAILLLNVISFPCLNFPMASARGPSGGGEGIAALAMLAFWLLSLGLLVPVVVARPRGSALNIAGVALGVLATLFIAAAFWSTGSFLDERILLIQVVDALNRPVGGVRIRSLLRNSQNLPWFSPTGPSGTTDLGGKCTLRFHGLGDGTMIMLAPPDSGASLWPRVDVALASEMSNVFYTSVQAVAVDSHGDVSRVGRQAIIRQSDRHQIHLRIIWPSSTLSEQVGPIHDPEDVPGDQ